ncbi:M28 family peptidase [Sediminibacter sp. Hel_I_10]|uniref:M28 family peptidase n=1 Tax=Sediminibacter sp. Hel_I_10 TaxID=1392490 RepID=UPI00047C9362|nr:M28 family peptidase [Sediminibacter sp. Hel_I_10]
MKLKVLIAGLCAVFVVSTSTAQNIQELINAVSLEELTLTLNEFSGEIPTTVNGNTVTIINRQQANNDIAADYLVERFESLDNLTIIDQSFNTNGRNIVAIQEGKTNPDNIYMVCAHYDSVANFCADDNATGTAAVLEMARILSTQCLENTIVYALWDEEEIGLLGSQFYANQAAANGDNILGVLNMDMMGYDGDNPGDFGDNEFDIDYRNIAGSPAMKDDIISVLDTYDFNLSVIEVNPGTFASDHSSFWAQGYSAVLLGESWETDDETPFYHSSNDRVATLDLPYYHELVKLVTGYITTKATLLPIDNTVTQTETTLTANQGSASYQWINAELNLPISGATNQTLMPTENGTYTVEITLNGCTETSQPKVVDDLNLEQFSSEELSVYPNPAHNFISIAIPSEMEMDVKIYDVSGKLQKEHHIAGSTTLNIEKLPTGVYFLSLRSKEKAGIFKIVKS